MKCAIFVAAAVLSVWPWPDSAWAEDAQALRGRVVSVEAPAAIPLTQPLRSRFGFGAMPAISASLPTGRWLLLGLRLRGGFLSKSTGHPDPAIREPAMGGLLALSALARFRPLGWLYGDSRATGPWIEVGAGGGLTGTLARPLGEAAIGWNFRWGDWILGPSARYLRVAERIRPLDGADAQLALVGVEIVMRDSYRPAPAVLPVVVAAAKPKVLDRDGDGIPDDLDKCPNEPEDKDGFEDEDGCPDPDNDKDGIPDSKDACPNEPETVNGVDDEDGCPDEAPIVVKEDRILLTEHLLFDTNRAGVRSAGRPALAAVLNLWNQHLEWDYLVIEGHADRRGPDPFNDWLSQERARRVRLVLIEMGFPPERLFTAAYGRKQPPVPGDNEQADRENRRVEFVIVKKVDVHGEGGASTKPSQSEKAGGTAP